MGKKKPQKTKSNARQSTDKMPDKKQLQNSKRTFVILIGVIIIATLAVILLSNGFSGFTSDNTNLAARQSTGSDAKNAPPASSSTPGPAISFPEPSYDFDTIAQGAKVTHTFVVKNTGTEPLKLIRAKGA